MDLGIVGRVALVLAGGGGLGRAIALRLAAEGATIAVAGRQEANTGETVQLIRDGGGVAEPLVWDLADLDAGRAAIHSATQQMGPVDILVGNTGGPPPSTAQGIARTTWTGAFAEMVLPVVDAAEAVLPGMLERRWGRVITCASSGVVTPIPNLALSNALRPALVGWSKTLAGEVAGRGVTVNVVLPGRIATERVATLDAARAAREGREVATVRADSLRTIPAGRYGEPDEFARVVTFLASDAASYVTGTTVRVDGGMIASV